mgnify:CR=1 FL=1
MVSAFSYVKPLSDSLSMKKPRGEICPARLCFGILTHGSKLRLRLAAPICDFDLLLRLAALICGSDFRLRLTAFAPLTVAPLSEPF